MKGNHLKVIPSFDKIGYKSILLEVWNILVTSFFTGPTVLDAIDFGCYCAFTCNGTSLPWRVAVEISSNVKYYRQIFKALGSFFLTLEQVDKKISGIQMNENPKQEARKIGHCTDNRSAPSEDAMNTDWSQHTMNILNIINVAFWNEDTYCLSLENREVAKKKKGRELLEHYLCSIKGVSSFYCHGYISLLSLLGIIPLSQYQHASFPSTWSNKCGPVRLANACLPDSMKKNMTPKQVFDSVRKDVNKVIGSISYLPVIQENQYCESWRKYTSKLKNIGKSHATEEVHDMNILTDSNQEGE